MINSYKQYINKTISRLNKYMDEIVRNTEDVMLSNLDFHLNSTARYVQNRRASTFFCSGSNEYSPVGVRGKKNSISTESGWLDPET